MAIASSLHAIEELIRSGVRGTLLVSRKGERRRRITELAEKSGSAVRWTDDREVEDTCGRSDHAGVVFVYQQQGGNSPRTDLKQFLAGCNGKTDILLLILDGVTDPQNLGAILRTADKFEVDAVVTSKRRSAGIGDAVLRASSGASVYIPLIEVVNLPRSIQALQDEGFWVYGADIAGEDISSVEFSGRLAVVMGSEGKGMSRLTRERCDGLIRIPVGGHVDSLNVSVAAGITLFVVTNGRFS